MASQALSAGAVPLDGDAQDRIWLRMVADNRSEQALTELFKRHRTMLLRVLVRTGATETNAEDVVQETFLKVMRSAPTFEGRSKVSTWLVQIAIRLHISVLRPHSKEVFGDDDFWEDLVARLADPAVGSDPLVVLMESAYAECCRRQYAAFAHENPQMAEALELATSDERLSGKQIAALLGRTETATRTFLKTCRKRLKRFLEPCKDLRPEASAP